MVTGPKVGPDALTGRLNAFVREGPGRIAVLHGPLEVVGKEKPEEEQGSPTALPSGARLGDHLVGPMLNEDIERRQKS